jgi:hypothetical protein
MSLRGAMRQPQGQGGAIPGFAAQLHWDGWIGLQDDAGDWLSCARRTREKVSEMPDRSRQTDLRPGIGI